MTEPWFIRNPAGLRGLETALRANHPTLHAFVEDDECWVRGTLSVSDAVQDWYQLEILLPPEYPEQLPKVWEVGGRIPRHVDRHVFRDGALCLGAPLGLWLPLDGDFSITTVVDGPLRSFLIGNSLVEQGEPWPHGELLHGRPGLLQQVCELVGSENPVDAALLLLDVANEELRGHSPCPCGSGKKFSKCHRDLVRRLHTVPESFIRDAKVATVSTAMDSLMTQRADLIVRRFVLSRARA